MSDEHVAAYYAGDLWLAYCSNVAPSEVEDLKASDDPKIRSALTLATEGLNAAVANARADRLGGSIVRSFIKWLRTVSRSERDRKSRAHQLRAHAGGAILHENWPGTGDPIVDLLTLECLRSYPAALIPPRLALGVRWNLPAVDAPSTTEFMDAAEADSLNLLFPLHRTDPTSDRSAYWQGPGEASTPRYPSELLQRLRYVSILRVLVVTGSLREEDVIRAAAKTVRDIRALAQGRSIETVTHAILDGIDLTNLPQQKISTALGSLRTANDFDMDIQGVNLESPVGWPRRSPQFIAEHAVSALIPTPEQMRILPIEESKQPVLPPGFPYDLEQHSALILETRNLIEDRLKKLRLCILLAGIKEEKIVESSLMTTSSLWLSGSDSYSGSNDPPHMWTTKIAASWTEKIERWAQLLLTLDISALDLAIERLLSAAERFGRDSIVDAIVAWEAMVGGSENTAFRVRTALAICIEPTDLTARCNIERRANELYGVRSQLVHGKSQALHTADSRSDAILMGLKLLAAILLQWQHLIPLNASERSSKILLTGPTGRTLDPHYV